MPEVYIHIIWPTGNRDSVYSPSSVIKNYFKAGESLTVEQFQSKAEEALKNASQRVKERFGFECSSAMGELDRLNIIINKIDDKNSVVKIISVD
jgi:uncharacterized repeat protein (TIGR04042 family)